ncbi:MAG: hypothetical protein ACYDH3_01885 [Candidatus Aminicenantales bacterium]
MKQFIYLALAVLTVGFPLFAAIDASGPWEMTMTTPRGEMKTDVVFVQTGEILAVTMTRIGHDGTPVEHKGEGTIKGADIEWKIARPGRNGEEMTMTYKGTIVNNNMKGTMEMSGDPGGGENRPPSPEWTAVRKSK